MIAGWFRSLFTKKKAVGQFQVPWVAYIANQDGPAEQELKKWLTETFLKTPAVRRGYLVRVRYGTGDKEEIALCIAATEPDEGSLVRTIGAHIAKVFAVTVHLDIMFLSKKEELEIQQTCTPFFQKTEF